MGCMVNATPLTIYPQERIGTHCIEGRVGHNTGLDGYGISRPHPESFPGPFRPQRIAIPTELFRRTKHVAESIKFVYIIDILHLVGIENVSDAYKFV